jgi:glycopeptide antibiotics resistance protein
MSSKPAIYQTVYVICCKSIGLPLHIRWSIYAVFAALAFTLSPFNFDPNTSQVFTWRWWAIDLFSNLFLLMPVGAALGLGLAHTSFKFHHVLLYLLFALTLSFAIEAMQLFIAVRTSQYWDVICNVTSFMLGLMIGKSFKPMMLHFKQLTTTILNNTEAFDRLISILLAVILLLVIRAISSSATIEIYDFALLCLVFFVFAHIFITVAVERKEPYHLQATVIYCAYVLFAAFFIYLIGLTLIELSTVFTLSEDNNNSEILNRSVMANKLVMAILMFSILIDCLKFMSIKFHITWLFNLILLGVITIAIMLCSLTLVGLLVWQESGFIYFFYIVIIAIAWINLSITQQGLRGINVNK